VTRKPDVDLDALRALVDGLVGAGARVERTPDGVSTQMYRIERDTVVLYARVAEDAGEDLTVEALLFEHLRGLGVPVPDVVHVGPFEDRSILVMTAVPGEHLGHCRDQADARAVAREAGRHLAALNAVPVTGRGWIVRAAPHWPLRGDDGDGSDWWLAHGDFDCTPIFQLGGRLTGFIDFGEIRGAERTFDLGHFLLHDGETSPLLLFDDLVAGYETVAPGVDLEAVRRSGLELGEAQLERWYTRGLPVDHAVAERRRRQLERLLLWSPP
jgi:aminoglycoside phosphotransferase